MSLLPRLFTVLSTISLVACVGIPSEPTVMALPGSGKSLKHFRTDDRLCKQYAFLQVGGKLSGQIAASDADTDFLTGELMEAESTRMSGFIGQQRYDMSYLQCMYVQGHRVPVAGMVASDPDIAPSDLRISEPPQGFTPPPPPPGNPPSPPPH